MPMTMLRNNSRRACCLYFLIYLQLFDRVCGGPYFENVAAIQDIFIDFSCNFFTCGESGDPEGICPVVEPLSEDEFDIDRYIEKTWYVQKQQINPYIQEDDMYCYIATYEPTALFSNVVQVNNYGNRGGVNQNAIGGTPDFVGLYAQQISGGEIRVAIGILGFQLPLGDGPYWVVARADDYSWAIITGGQPDEIRQETPNVLCTTQEEPDNFLDANGGLWFFTRDRIASSTTIATMEATLDTLGIYGGNLLDVTQEGCNYEGALIK